MIKPILKNVICAFMLVVILSSLPLSQLFAQPLDSTLTHQVESQQAGEFNWDSITAQMVLTTPNSRDQVQVFDVEQGHVIKSVNNSKKVQKQVKLILKDVYEFAPEVQPDMKAKYIIRIPVKAETSVNVNDTSISIDELFIFYYVDKEPLLLVFDENKKPFLFHTKHSIEPLLKVIQVE